MEKNEIIFPYPQIETYRLQHLEILKKLKEKLIDWEKFVNSSFSKMKDKMEESVKSQKYDDFEISSEEFLIDNLRVVDNEIKKIDKSIYNKLLGKKKTSAYNNFFSEENMKKSIKSCVENCKKNIVVQKNVEEIKFLFENEEVRNIKENVMKKISDANLSKYNLLFCISFKTRDRNKFSFLETHFIEYASAFEDDRYIIAGIIRNIENAFDDLRSKFNSKIKKIKIEIVNDRLSLLKFLEKNKVTLRHLKGNMILYR